MPDNSGVLDELQAPTLYSQPADPDMITARPRAYLKK
jgi:hypothetical protein